MAQTSPRALCSCRIPRLAGRVNGGACAIACDARGAIDAAGLPWTIVRRRAARLLPWTRLTVSETSVLRRPAAPENGARSAARAGREAGRLRGRQAAP
jgi:hypothetical protein